MKRLIALFTALLLCLCLTAQAESALTTTGGNAVDVSALAH